MQIMNGVWGSFETMPLSDLLVYFAEKRSNSSLRCKNGPHEKAIKIRNGVITCLSSNRVSEGLGRLLITYGHINEDELEQAVNAQKETQVLLGKILVMIGLVEEEIIRDILSMKIREGIMDIMRWPEGQFHFFHDLNLQNPPSIEIEVSVQELLSEAEFREIAWNSILQVFPTEELALTVSTDDIPEEPGHPLDERIIHLAVEGYTIAEIGKSLHAPSFALHQRLLALHRLGVLETFLPDEDLRPALSDDEEYRETNEPFMEEESWIVDDD